MHQAVRGHSTAILSLAALCAVVILGIDLTVTLLLIRQGGQPKLIYSDAISLVIDFLVSGVLLITTKRSATQSKRIAFAWWMIALSTVAYALGDTTWAIIELILEEAPFPSIADAFYLAYYPFLLIGVLLLLPDKPASHGEQVNKVLDVSIVMLAAILGFWNFLLGPIISSNADSSRLEQIILLAYPVFDLVLLWALLRLLYNRPDLREAGTVFLLAGSIAITIVLDTIFTYQSLLEIYDSGGILDVGWRTATLLIGLAGISQISAFQPLKNSEKAHRRLEFLIDNLNRIAPYFPYFWLIAAYLVLIQSRFVALPMNFLLLSLGVGLIICLVLLRQIIMVFENRKLNTQLQQAMEELQVQSTKLEKTNRELQNEIGERKEMEKLLIHDSLHDAMTGLANRVLFLDRLGQAIQSCKRRTEAIFSVIFIDLDQFKVINDSLGHLTGDQLLISVGKRMKDCLRSSDTVARFGGDEFAILLEITGGKNSASLVAEKLQEAIRQPLKLNGHELYVTASIGLVLNIMGYERAEDILRDADIAMYHAKASGKARFEIFDINMRSQAFSRLETEQQLRAALENQEFQLYYQPIISLKTNALVSVEALIRWHHPKRGILLPSEFLPIAEASGLILSIENWVLNEACAQLKKWHEKYPCFQHMSVNVNVSSRQFAQPNFVAELVEALQRNNLKPESLKLEITEGVLISNFAAANKVFNQLCDLGIQLQIDDFGSGYSSLGYLQYFPISAVKIDKSFIDGMGKGRKGVELIRAIVSMTRELDMEVTAEGIETNEQLSELKSLLCTFGQGFLLSRPLDKETTGKILAERESEIIK